MTVLSKALLLFVSFSTSTGCFIADWNETHIYNNRWPPHAKFHNGQTMSMGALLGVVTAFYTLRPARTAELRSHFLDIVAWAGALYWVTQLSAFAYPGSLAVDPEFGTGAPQVYICAVLLLALTAGIWLERRALEDLGGAMKAD
ncbi:hypothetical protein AAWM_06069 [Aspergillus awamori]|uniref:Acetyltransferase n=1 Tax=Aspergillus awamori TaxID=105351 RepID=A0A401KV56_ASPAW|nr:hypothetical protein AAWM_06069 [Aspergillus awamori]GKZ56712.1 hypothetical protein AnigIFM49718_001982 [Aspergillus niger]GKZ64203.1 hypothetical protein AnigIFM50267_003665 [Aspergillus niger]GLA36454.1 hypothetical protein AnigIFM63309_002558 [Aspergillus niger]